MERVRQERQVRVDVRVDEPGRHDPASDVEPPPGLRLAERADGGDPVAAHAHVRAEPRAAGAVDHTPACQDEIEHARSFLARGSSRQLRSPGARPWLL